MPDEEFVKLLEENRENLKEMFAFWKFIQGLNTVLRWMVYIGAPIALGLYGLYKFINKN